MLPYFPFQDGEYTMTMGTQALKQELIIEVDTEHYQEELAYKEKLLAQDHAYYCQTPAETLPLQWETLELLLPQMAQRYPACFTLTIHGSRWHWQNMLLNQETSFVLGEPASLPVAPLDWLGRQVQEDLLLLADEPSEGIPLVAGHLCFPNDWCLCDKMSQSFLTIHQPVPLFAEQIGRSSQLLLERLKVGRPVWRVNWAFKATSRLDLTPRTTAEQREASRQLMLCNIGERCFLRIERQTLSRLPHTRAILFTVHTYQTPVSTVVRNTDHARRILAALQTIPESMLHYKGMQGFSDLLLTYVQAHSS